MISINGIPAESVGLEVGRFSLRKRARQNYEVINIPGKLTPNIVPLSSYSPVSIAVPADLFDYSRIDEVYKWLGTGKAVLIDEREPDKYRVGYCFEEVTVDCYNEEMCSLAFNFVCEPFLYKVDEEPIKLAVGGNTVVKTAGINTAPVFKITPKVMDAPTQIQIVVNEQYFQLVPPEYAVQNGFEITIDCGEKITYYTDQTDANHIISSSTSGEYPLLIGSNAANSVHIYGNITAAEINPKTRWL